MFQDAKRSRPDALRMQPALVTRAASRSSNAAVAQALIELVDVAKTYRTRDGEVESLRPLTFDIAEGEFLAVVGPSGCGKSTLLKMVAGLLPSSKGRILLNGKEVNGPPDDVGI